MKTRKVKITLRIFILISVIVIIANSIMGGMFYAQTSTNNIREIGISAKSLAESAAQSIDPDCFLEAIEMGQNSDGFASVDDDLSAFLVADQLKYVYSFYKDESGKVRFVVDTDDEGASYGTEYQSDELMEEAFLGNAVADTESSSDEWGVYLSAYSPIFKDNQVIGIVGVDVDYSIVEDTLNQLKLFLILLSLAIYIVLLVSIGIICRKLNQGFNTLNDKVLELAGSDGDLSKHVEITTGDEFETIATNFNNFINQVHGLTCMVGDASRDNADIVARMNDDITSLSANMQECSATAEAVSDNMGIIAEQTNEFAMQLGQTNDFVTEKSKKATSEAEYAIKQMEMAKGIIADLNSQIQEAFLEAKSIEQVEDVVAEINDISLQTQILSLNARVEASRAGEAGKGFAVVATEISELSGKTSEAVQGIDEINLRVQKAMQVLNKSVSELNKFMVGTVLTDYEGYANLGTEFGESTKAISKQMMELNDNSSIISDRISQANLSVADITNAISDSANQLEQVSLSSDSILNSMQDLLKNSLL